MKTSIRSMVVASPFNMLISVDLSQAESWIVAYSAREENMKHSLNESDIHSDTAAALFFPDNYCAHVWNKIADESKLCRQCELIITYAMRYIGKRYNHATSYQMKPPRAAQVINKDSDKPPYVTVTIKESRVFSERWHARYKIKQWWSEIEAELNRTRILTNAYGRERMFFAQWGDELFREATAYGPQSSVADHFNGAIHPELGIKGGLREIYKQLIKPYKDHKIINESHDSCILDVPKVVVSSLTAEAKQLLTRPLIIKGETFTIPVDAQIGERWGELEKS